MRDLAPSSILRDEEKTKLIQRFARQTSISIDYATKLLKENDWNEKAALLAYADSSRYEEDAMLPSTSSEKLNDFDFERRRRGQECNGKTLHTPAYAFILPNLSRYPEDFRRFLERDMIEMATLRRLENSGHLNWWCGNNTCQRLWPLSTTGDGNCLLHAASLGMWGVHDRQLMLRNALHDVLTRGSRRHAIQRRWRWNESKTNLQSELVLSETEWANEWNTVVEIAAATPRIKSTSANTTAVDASKSSSSSSENDNENAASQKSEVDTSINNVPSSSTTTNGSSTSTTTPPKPSAVNEQIYESLESIHVFVLAHILKRPIIVVADTVLRNANGEELSPIPFGGIYLPLEWTADKCHRSPLVLCYDSAHFSALVAMRHTPSNALQAIPITDRNRNLLPLHFAVDPGPDFTWWNDDGDMKIATTFDSMQTDDWRIDLIGRYMDIVKMDLRRGSVKKTTTVANGNVSIPSKLLTLASGTSSSSCGDVSRSTGITRNGSIKSQSRIFTEVLQHFKRIGKFTRRKKSGRDVTITANELKQANCVVTVLLHNYTHQYMDHMVNTYISSAKERFDKTKGMPSAAPPPKNRMSRSFSASSVMLTCINGDCEETASPSTNFLCDDCFEYQKREIALLNCGSVLPVPATSKSSTMPAISNSSTTGTSSLSSASTTSSITSSPPMTVRSVSPLLQHATTICLDDDITPMTIVAAPILEAQSSPFRVPNETCSTTGPVDPKMAVCSIAGQSGVTSTKSVAFDTSCYTHRIFIA